MSFNEAAPTNNDASTIDEARNTVSGQFPNLSRQPDF
ncbi:hypothetical protein QBD00_003336 [Ochrobactrum sp. AN78]|nr:hypothetical protein [Ochrobactrum sp. AN78]